MAGKQPCRKGLGDAGWQQAQVEPAVFPCSQEGKPHPGAHLTKHGQLAKRGDYPTVFSTGAASAGHSAGPHHCRRMPRSSNASIGEKSSWGECWKIFRGEAEDFGLV